MTNFDRIKKMSVEEMADGISSMLIAHLNKFIVSNGNPMVILTDEEKHENATKWKQYLESESDTK